MSVRVYVERGSKRAFASAVDWPGWSRSGPDEAAALEALAASAPRIARAMKRKRLPIPKVTAVSDFEVVERLEGNTTTDFGAPSAISKPDTRPASPAEMRELAKILEACWAEFDAAAASARGKTLAKGPRGGGRSLAAIADHAMEAERGYIGAVGGTQNAERNMAEVRAAFVAAVAARARGEVPDRGPRGGVRWPARFAVRRSAWHWLDHAWEIEDRAGRG